MALVGPRQLDPTGGARHVRATAAAVAAARPDALIFAGEPWRGALPFVARARDARLPVLVPDGWLAGPEVFAAIGSRAAGLLVTSPGMPEQRWGPAARRFAQDFRATQPGGRMTVEGLYTAQATEVLLDAIARSDGTRASVSRELLATRIEDGLVGPVRFDAAGDVTPSPFALVRLSPSARTVSGLERDGSNLVDVVAGR
jgi:ABC-type branched-subunit amino acid transport system substrate-binding protein